MMKRTLTLKELKKINTKWLEKEQNRRFSVMMRHCYFNHESILNLPKESHDYFYYEYKKKYCR